MSDDCATSRRPSPRPPVMQDSTRSLLPPAGLPGCATLAVFAHALPNVTAERSQIRQPPPRLAASSAVDSTTTKAFQTRSADCSRHWEALVPKRLGADARRSRGNGPHLRPARPDRVS